MLDGIPFSEKEFYQQQDEHDRRWGRAINFAIVLHAAIFIGALYLPNLFDRKPLLDEVMTIDLVSLPEPAETITQPTPSAPEQKTVPKPEPVQPPPKPEKAVPVEPVRPDPEPVPTPVVEAKPISVRPLKRKIKKAKDTRLVEEKQRQQRAEKLKRQKLERKRAIARARALEKQAADEARRARAELASVIREAQAVRSAPRRASGRSSGSKQVNSALEKQYYMDLASRVQRLWVLPEIKKWSPSLETIVEFTVLRDGRLINVQIAKSSGDTFFDRFARETVKKAAPMPPFPAVLKKDRMDLGFRLRPAGIQQ